MPRTVGGFVWVTGTVEQTDERIHLFRREMAQL